MSYQILQETSDTWYPPIPGAIDTLKREMIRRSEAVEKLRAEHEIIAGRLLMQHAQLLNGWRDDLLTDDDRAERDRIYRETREGFRALDQQERKCLWWLEPEYKTSEGKELLDLKLRSFVRKELDVCLKDIQTVQEEVEAWRTLLLANQTALEELAQRLIKRSRKKLDLRVDKFIGDTKNLINGLEQHLQDGSPDKGALLTKEQSRLKRWLREIRRYQKKVITLSTDCQQSAKLLLSEANNLDGLLTAKSKDHQLRLALKESGSLIGRMLKNASRYYPNFSEEIPNS
jgi:hypothetical protein